MFISLTRSWRTFDDGIHTIRTGPIELNIDAIKYFTVDDNKTVIFLTNGSVEVVETLDEVKRKLGSV